MGQEAVVIGVVGLTIAIEVDLTFEGQVHSMRTSEQAQRSRAGWAAARSGMFGRPLRVGIEQAVTLKAAAQCCWRLSGAPSTSPPSKKSANSEIPRRMSSISIELLSTRPVMTEALVAGEKPPNPAGSNPRRKIEGLWITPPE